MEIPDHLTCLLGNLYAGREATIITGHGTTDWFKVGIHQSCPTLFNPMAMEFSRQEYWSGEPFPSPGDLPNPGIKPRSPALQADSLPIEPPGEPKNSGVGGLSLLQGIFLTQE